jgi:hypothetical protein
MGILFIWSSAKFVREGIEKNRGVGESRKIVSHLVGLLNIKGSLPIILTHCR